MLTGVAAFLLLLIALLAIPVTLTFQASWPQAFQDHIKLQWAFGLVSVRLPSPQPKASSIRGVRLKLKLCTLYVHESHTLSVSELVITTARFAGNADCCRAFEEQRNAVRSQPSVTK